MISPFNGSRVVADLRRGRLHRHRIGEVSDSQDQVRPRRRACLHGRCASDPLETRSFDVDLIFARQEGRETVLPLLAGSRGSQLMCRKPDGLHLRSPDDTASGVVHNAGNRA